MKKIILVIILIGAVSLAFPKKSAKLPGVMTPYSFAVDDGQFYIGEESTISVYTLENFKFVKTFGKQGEGPAEFKSIPFLEIFPDYLVANCFNKLLFFTRQGKYVNEIRTPSLFTLFVYPVGENFVGLTVKSNNIKQKKIFAIDLFDKNMKLIKEIARDNQKIDGKKSGKPKIKAIEDYFRHKVYGKHIYVANTKKGFFIEVFDSMGNKIYEINKKYEKLKITDKYKEDFFKKKNNSKDALDEMIRRRYRYIFREDFPAFKDFIVKNGKIYVFTYKRKNKKNEIVIMDLKGNILGCTFVTQSDANLYSIANDRYYFLEENDKTEEWEITIEEI